MALTPTQEAQVIELVNKQAALLSLANNEATITSKLAAPKVNLGQLAPAASLTDTDLLLVRQGTTDKSATGAAVKSLAQNGSVLTTGDQTIGGNKTFSNPIVGSTTTQVSRTSATGSAIVPVGTTAQRDASPAAGYLRYNSSLSAWEGYNGTAWDAVARDLLNTTRIDVASASTVDLTTLAPNTRHIRITGLTTINAFTVAAGQTYFVTFASSGTITNNANIVTNTGQNISRLAGDSCIIRATAANTVEVLSYWRVSTFYDPLYQSQIQPINAAINGGFSTLTISANNPLQLDFRSSALNSGTVNRRYGTPAPLTISLGSTLGTVNGVTADLAVLAIDNAGTIELAVRNMAGGPDLSETNLINTVAEGGGGAADSADVIYSNTARTAVPYRVLGVLRSTQPAAGSWTVQPSLVQGAGGNATSGPRFAPRYVSADQTVTFNAVLNLAHGLGVRPSIVNLALKCAVAEGGYAVGDEILFASIDASGIYALSLSFDATNITVSTQGTIRVTNKSTTALVSITAANWRWVARAWL
jgi:hypothetical protein